MVVYRKEPNTLDHLTGTTAAHSVEEGSNEIKKNATNGSHLVPRAILTSRPDSHPFQERSLILDQPVKVGRSVARCRPAASNAIFDCKVLSRNHALLWYEHGKFYLQDTKSSNGTFVNNQRLSKGSEESPAREVCSGDIVQFGVDVVENSRKVVHGCIVATLKLYLPDGKEAKASPTTAVVPLSPETSITSQEIYQLSQYLQEALHREQILEIKLGTLQKVVANTQDESDIGWKALIEEDRLLSRIETLESQLQTCGKNVTEEKLKDYVLKLQEDKDKYQNAAKESLKKILQEKLEAIRKVQDLENSLSNTENECTHLGEINKKNEQEIQLLLEKSSEDEKEIASLMKKLKEAEERYQDLVSQSTEDKLALENNAEEMRKEEQMLSTKIEALQAENDFAKEQLTAMKAHYDILKKDQIHEVNLEKNGNVSPNEQLNSTITETSVKISNQELSCEVNQLELELQRVQKENFKNETIYSDSEECNTNGDAKPIDYINKLQNDIQYLKKVLTETREDKKIVDNELMQMKTQFDEIQNNAKKLTSDLLNVQEQLSIARQNLKDKNEQIIELQNLLQPTIEETKDDSNEKELSHKKGTNDFKLHEESPPKSIPDNESIVKNNIDIYEEKIQTLEADLVKRLVENSQLEAQSKILQEKCDHLNAAKLALENKDDVYWKDHTIVARVQLDETNNKLSSAQEEIILIKERYEELNREKSYLQAEYNKLNERLQLLSMQSKTVSLCSVIPLLILAIAIMLAFYPTLAYFTATSDQI